MHARFIINPSAGKRKDLDALRNTIERRCGRSGLAASIRQCADIASLDGLVEEARSDAVGALIAVGGDGTVHAIGTRLIGSSIALGILPVGSGNGLARHLGIPTDPVAAVDAIATARTETMDTATAGERHFLGVAGVGFDAEVAHRFGLEGRRGLESYLRETLLLMRSYRAADYGVTIDGEVLRTKALLVAIANSSQYGNEARIAPDASLADGLLDVCIVADPPLPMVPLLLRKLFRGELEDGHGVTIRRGAVIDIERPDAGPAHVDGEPIGLPARVRFAVRPRSLRILIPRFSKGI